MRWLQPLLLLLLLSACALHAAAQEDAPPPPNSGGGETIPPTPEKIEKIPEHTPEAGGGGGGERSAEHEEEVRVLRERLAAAEAAAAAAAKLADDRERAMEQARTVEAGKLVELERKGKELQAALEAQMEASAAIKKESDQAGLTLKQAHEQMEAKAAALEAELARERESGQKKIDPEHVAKLEEQLEGYKDMLNREKEAMRAVVKLRQEKEELKSELASARESNLIYKAQTVWLPRAQESFNDLSVLAGDHFSSAAEKASAGLNTAATAMEEIVKQVDKHPHAQVCRDTAKPWLDQAFTHISGGGGELLAKIRHPLPAWRDAVVSAVSGMGAFAQYKDAAGEASDYWVLHLPLFLLALISSSIWVSRGLRWYSLRLQQVLFLVWGGIALVGWLYSSDGMDLVASAAPPAHLAALHVACLFSLLIVACAYALLVLTLQGPLLGAMQLACVVWVLQCYYYQAMLPLLTVGHKPGQGFTRAHLLRSLVATIVAYWGLEGTPPPPRTNKKGREDKTKAQQRKIAGEVYQRQRGGGGEGHHKLPAAAVRKNPAEQAWYDDA